MYGWRTDWNSKYILAHSHKPNETEKKSESLSRTVQYAILCQQTVNVDKHIFKIVTLALATFPTKVHTSKSEQMNLHFNFGLEISVGMLCSVIQRIRRNFMFNSI